MSSRNILYRIAGMDRRLLLPIFVAAWLMFFFFDLDEMFRFQTLKNLQYSLKQYYEAYPIRFVASFLTVHIVALVLMLPGVVLSFSLIAGAVLGLEIGFVVMLTSLTIGDTLSMLIVRHAFRGWAERRFGSHLARVGPRVERDGWVYLLSMRLMAAIPFFIINITMALTRMPVRIYAPVSMAGLVPATAIYVHAGVMLASIDTLSDVLSARVLISLALLGLIPGLVRILPKRSA